jgi:ATP-dependent protease ClpP protease subunit
MPSKHHKSNEIIESQLAERLRTVEDTLGCDAMAFVGPIVNPLADDIRDAVEGIPEKRNKLAVILETFGGYVDSARRIAETLRFHYPHVDFIVPNHAMSAGTILVILLDSGAN